MKNHDIPNGASHIELLSLSAAHVARQEEEAFKTRRDCDLQFIGVCMCALYQAATCHRECHGSAHILESLCGRAYNLAASALHLSRIGYYDEALNLSRGIGEIVNLVSLSIVDSNAIKEWISTDEKTRRNKYSPAGVRALLERSGNFPIIVDREWYSELCERYTHVTPETRPNFHDALQARCGGDFQEKGLDKVLGHLAEILGWLSMLICKYFSLDDLLDEIYTIVRAEDSQHTDEAHKKS